MAGIIVSIEEVNLTMTGTSVSAGLSKGQTIANCVPFATCRVNTGTDWQDDIVTDIYFSAGSVYAERVASAGTIYVKVYVVEFDPSKVKVQTGTFSTTGTQTDVGITTVDESKTFLVLNNKSSASNSYQAYGSRVRGWILAGGASIRFNRNYAGSGTISGNWYIVEDLSGAFSTQHVSIQISGGNTLNTGGISSVDTDRSFIVSSTSTSYNAAEAQQWQCKVWFTSSTTIGAERLGTSNSIWVEAYIVTFSDSSRVQHGEFTYTTTTANASIDAVDVDQSFPLGTVPAGMMQGTDYSGNFPQNFHTLDLTSSTNIDGERYANTTALDARWQVVEFASKVYYFDGYVKEEGVAVVRAVRVHQRNTGDMVFETTSSGLGGYFYGETSYSGIHYVLVFDDAAGASYNALVYDNVIPITVS
jgi:hypothetical protein